nr:putative ATP synthase CF0 B subunit [Picea sitchensis]
MRGERMKNVIDPFISLSYWPSAGGFGSNTNILETNIINPSLVLSVLIYFGKGVLPYQPILSARNPVSTIVPLVGRDGLPRYL